MAGDMIRVNPGQLKEFVVVESWSISATEYIAIGCGCDGYRSPFGVFKTTFANASKSIISR